MPRVKYNPLGLVFGRLTVTAPAGADHNGCYRWVCECECGGRTVAYGSDLKKGCTTSCGCLQRERTSKANTTHGQSTHPLHSVWRMIKQRCYNPKSRDYKHYGGRGIAMCPEWKTSFAAFLSDMGERPAGMSIDRINNDGPYAPDNCRWATQTEQVRNRRNT